MDLEFCVLAFGEYWMCETGNERCKPSLSSCNPPGVCGRLVSLLKTNLASVLRGSC